MRWDYPPLDINPVFPGHGEKEIIIIIIIIVIVIIIVVVVVVIIIIMKKGKRVLWCFITALQTF